MDYAITYRPAVSEDAKMLSKWDSAAHMQDIKGNSGWWHWQDELADPGHWREMLIAELDGEPFAFLQIMNAGLDPEDYWQNLDTTNMAIDMWIGRAEHLYRGLGKQIMRHAVSVCFENAHVTSVWLDPLASNRSAISFYQKFGFLPVEIRQQDADLLHIHKLNRIDWERKTDGGAY